MIDKRMKAATGRCHSIACAAESLMCAIDECCPDGFEKTTAKTNLHYALLWANDAIAQHERKLEVARTSNQVRIEDLLEKAFDVGVRFGARTGGIVVTADGDYTLSPSRCNTRDIVLSDMQREAAQQLGELYERG